MTAAAGHLLLDGAASGPWNMAVDEALLETADGIWLRFYGWSEPTLSLGYFQSIVDRREHRASRDCSVVRRSTGGGAILHDRELTYSLVLPHAHPLAGTPEQLSLAVHTALLAALRVFDLPARLHDACGPRCSQPALPTAMSRSLEPFLCFQRRANGDVLLGDAKIGGSAQRRRKQAVLQHGSILLETSAYAPELPGIRAISGREISATDLASQFVEQLQARLELSLRPVTSAEIPAATHAYTADLIGEKYAHLDWTTRR